MSDRNLNYFLFVCNSRMGMEHGTDGGTVMDFVALIGLFCVFMCPMIFGGITFIYSHEVTKNIGKEI